MATKYIVLARLTEEPGWKILSDSVEATSKKKAEEMAFLAKPDNVVEVNAVPLRSWDPQTIRLEPRAKFGE